MFASVLEVDTTLAQLNGWRTLVFHGIDDLGWSAVPGERAEGLRPGGRVERWHGGMRWQGAVARGGSDA